MSYPKKLVAHLKRGIPADDLDEELIPDAFKNAVEEWKQAVSRDSKNAKARTAADAKLCEALSLFLTANFAPENLPAAKKILTKAEDIECSWIKVTGFDFDGNNIPIVNLEAGFSLEFKKNWSQEDLSSWEAKQDDPLAWCVNFWWSFDEVDEDDWEGYLDTNDGVDLVISE